MIYPEKTKVLEDACSCSKVLPPAACCVAFIWAGLSCPVLLLISQETGLLFVPSALNGDERGYAHRQSLSDSQAYIGSKMNVTQSKRDRRKMKANVPGFYAFSLSGEPLFLSKSRLLSTYYTLP